MTSIKVAVRVRPLSERESDEQSKVVVDICGKDVLVTDVKVPGKCNYDHRVRVHRFSFDYGFWSVEPTSTKCASQKTVYEEFGRVVLNTLLDGYNSCVIAYGPSGSGKTYTMIGTKDEMGLTPRICEGLFTKLTDCTSQHLPLQIDISYLEICNEQVYDLLNSNDGQNNRKPKLRIREHPIYGPFVEGLSVHVVKNVDEVCELLERGNDARITSDIHTNERSNRSHAIFTIQCSQAYFDESKPREVVSKLHLVDLAGSERAVPEYCQSRIKEGGNINKSLVTLGNVISVLVELSNQEESKYKRTYVPYRDSNLTWLLRDSLGGNSHTFMLAAISPSKECYIETVSTLRYAQRAKLVLNSPVINEEPCNETIQNLHKEVVKLRCFISTTEELSQAYVMKPQAEVLHLKSIMKESAKRVDLLTRHWLEKWLQTYDSVLSRVRKLEKLREDYSCEDSLSINEDDTEQSEGKETAIECALLCEDSVRSSREECVMDYNDNQGSVNLYSHDSCDKIFDKLRQYYSLPKKYKVSDSKSISENILRNSEVYHERLPSRALSLSQTNFNQACRNYSWLDMKNPKVQMEHHSDSVQAAAGSHSENDLNVVEPYVADVTSSVVPTLNHLNDGNYTDFERFTLDTSANVSLVQLNTESLELAEFNNDDDDHVNFENLEKHQVSQDFENEKETIESNLPTTAIASENDYSDNLVMAQDIPKQMVVANDPQICLLDSNPKKEFLANNMGNYLDMFNERVYEGSKQVIEFLKLARPELVDCNSGCCSPKRKDSEIMSLLSFSSLDAQCLRSLDDISSNDETESSCCKSIELHHYGDSSRCTHKQSLDGHRQKTASPLQLTSTEYQSFFIDNKARYSLPTSELSIPDFRCFETSGNETSSNEFTQSNIRSTLENQSAEMGGGCKLSSKESFDSNRHKITPHDTSLSSMPSSPMIAMDEVVNDSNEKFLLQENNLSQCSEQLREDKFTHECDENLPKIPNVNNLCEKSESIQMNNLKLTKTNLDLLALKIKKETFDSSFTESSTFTKNHICDHIYGLSSEINIIDKINIDNLNQKGEELPRNLEQDTTNFQIPTENCFSKTTVQSHSSASSSKDFSQCCQSIADSIFSCDAKPNYEQPEDNTIKQRNYFLNENILGEIGEHHPEHSLPSFLLSTGCDSTEQSDVDSLKENKSHEPLRISDNHEHDSIEPKTSVEKKQIIEDHERESESDFNDSLTLDSLDNFDQEMKAWANKYLTKYDFQKTPPFSVCDKVLYPDIINQSIDSHDSVEVELTSRKTTFKTLNKVSICPSNSTSSDSITYVFVGKDEDSMKNNFYNSNSRYSSLLNSLSLDSLEKSALHPKLLECSSPRTLSIDSLLAEEMLHQLQNEEISPMKKSDSSQHALDTMTESNICRQSNFLIASDPKVSFENMSISNSQNLIKPTFVVDEMNNCEKEISLNDFKCSNTMPQSEQEFVIPPPLLFTSEQISLETRKENNMFDEENHIEKDTKSTQTENFTSTSESQHLESTAGNILQLTLRLMDFMEKTINYVKNDNHCCCKYYARGRWGCMRKPTRQKLIVADSTSDDCIEVPQKCSLVHKEMAWKTEDITKDSYRKQIKMQTGKKERKGYQKQAIASENSGVFYSPKCGMARRNHVFRNADETCDSLQNQEKLPSFLHDYELVKKNAHISMNKSSVLNELESNISNIKIQDDTCTTIAEKIIPKEKLEHCSSSSRQTYSENYLKHLRQIQRQVMAEAKCIYNHEKTATFPNRTTNAVVPGKDMHLDSSSEGYLSSITSLTSSLHSDSCIDNGYHNFKHSKTRKSRNLTLDLQTKQHIDATPSTSSQNTSADSGAFFLDSLLIEKANPDFNEAQRERPDGKVLPLGHDLGTCTKNPRDLLHEKCFKKLSSIAHTAMMGTNGSTKSKDLLIDNPSNDLEDLNVLDLTSRSKFECETTLRNNSEGKEGYQDYRSLASTSIRGTQLEIDIGNSLTRSKEEFYRNNIVRIELVKKLCDSTYKLTRQDIEGVLNSIEADKMFLRKRRNPVLDQTYFPEVTFCSPLSSSNCLFPYDSYKRLPTSALYLNFPSSKLPA